MLAVHRTSLRLSHTHAIFQTNPPISFQTRMRTVNFGNR